MSAYHHNQVPRLSANPAKMLLAGPAHDQPTGTQAAERPQRPAGTQRKWRVLVSIGLLLPALAAIIGIVAWTISIEVANSDQQGPLSAARRRAERAQQQQQQHHQQHYQQPQHQLGQLHFRRDEAVALGALVAARRSAARHHQRQPTGSADEPQQQQQQQQGERVPLPVAEAVVASAAAAAVVESQQARSPLRPAAVTARPTRSSPPQQQQRQQRQHQAAAISKRQHRMSQAGEPTSALTLEDLDQVEASSDENNDNKERAAPDATAAASSQSDAQEGAGFGEPADERTESTSGEQRDAPTGNTSDHDNHNRDKAAAPSEQTEAPRDALADVAGEPAAIEQRQSDEHKSDDGGSSLSDKAAAAAQEEQEREATRAAAKRRKQQPQRAQNNGTGVRSRWLAASRRPAREGAGETDAAELPAGAARKLTKQQQQQQQQQNKRRHQGAAEERQAAASKTNSKYTLLLGARDSDALHDSSSNNNSRSNNNNNEDEEGAAAASESPAAKSQQLLFSTTPATVTSTTTDASDCQERLAAEARRRDALARAETGVSGGGGSGGGGSGDDEDISFEAIASAISKTLSADDNSQPPLSSLLDSGAGDGDGAQFASSGAGESGPADLEQPERVASTREQTDLERESEHERELPATSSSAHERRRTTGQHLAEVIDHLVDRRKQQQQQQQQERHHHQEGARFGDRDAIGGQPAQLGPQIVVVAPVGPSGALLKARSLTKAEEPTAKTGASKKPLEAVKKPLELASKRAKPTGGRLLGVGPTTGSSESGGGGGAIKYSERVEVIEDEDSSALLVAGRHQGALRALSPDHSADDQPASIHVSSHSGEARFRAPRHELSSRLLLERYAPLARAPPEEQPAASGSQAKLYSAEQLIRSHILKSKSAAGNQKSPAPIASQQPRPSALKEEQQQQPRPVPPQQQAATSSTPSPPPPPPPVDTSTAAAPTTTSAPVPQTTTSKGVEQLPTNRQQQQQQDEHRRATLLQQIQPQSGQFQSVQVPAFFMQQAFRPQPAPDAYQVMESQQQQVRVAPSVPQKQESQSEGQPQPQAQQAQQVQHHQQQQQQQQQQPLMLPTFADQEIQVPAHLAESVIRDLQTSPSTVTGMLHGRPMLFQALSPSQASLQQQLFQLQQQQSYHRLNSMAPQQQQQYQMAAESQQRLQFAAPSQPAASPTSTATSFGPFSFLGRLVAGRRQHEQQQQQQQQLAAPSGAQVLANRDSSAKDDRNHYDSKQVHQQHQQTSGSFMSSVKSLGPRSLVQPAAQMALKHLLSSLGQQAESLGQQAAAQQAQADAAAEFQHQRHHRSSAPSQVGAAQPQQQRQQQQQQHEAMLSSGSSPIGMAALPPAGHQQQQLQTPDQLAGSASARSMRSLPIGAQAPFSQQQVQSIADQEVQESYGQMPTYQMAPDPYGGGGGAHYESPDKKSKGITFHFGGGPIGGGTQLITSPMGIFKHLMIPLMPNPRVNLNGKVVFGVVLEKTTAFGPPPKKKHKFWGR